MLRLLHGKHAVCRRSNALARQAIRTSAQRNCTTKAHDCAPPTFSTKVSGPQRVDWKERGKNIVYVKGVPVKGSLFRLRWSDQFIHFLIFSVAGSLAAYVVRPQINYLSRNGFLGLPEDSGWVKGPWLFRVLYIAIMYPAYSCLLFLTASVFGRRIWFSFMLHKMWSRFLTKRASHKLAYILDIQHY